MLTVTNLSKSYGRQTLFEGASFQVAPGERVGVVGRNGSGKTTLFRILLGEEAADSGAVTVPSGYRIGYLAQHLRFDHPTVLAEAASALPPREDGTDETYRAKAVLAGLGFSEDDYSMDPAALSGVDRSTKGVPPRRPSCSRNRSAVKGCFSARSRGMPESARATLPSSSRASRVRTEPAPP